MTPSFGKIFISYAWDHRAPEHHNFVSALDTRLQNVGYITTLDINHLPRIGASNTHLWLERAVKHANWVVVIVTEKYIQKCDDRDDGNALGYEIDQIISKFVKKGLSNRIIPALRPGANITPSFIPMALAIDFRDDARFEKSFSELLERLRDSLPSEENPSLTKAKLDYKTIKQIPIHHWQFNSDRTKVLCSSNPEIQIILLRQMGWVISDAWVINTLGPGSYMVSLVLKEKQHETFFDFVSDAEGRCYLPFSNNPKRTLQTSCLADYIGRILNSSNEEHYVILKRSAGIHNYD